MGGRPLIIYVLTIIIVYWFSLFKIYQSILNILRKKKKFSFYGLVPGMSTNTIWYDGRDWIFENPCGVGISRIVIGSHLDPCMKSMWRGLFDCVLWRNVLQDKYLRGKTILQWFRSFEISLFDASTIWNGFIRSFYWINWWIS